MKLQLLSIHILHVVNRIEIAFPFTEVDASNALELREFLANVPVEHGATLRFDVSTLSFVGAAGISEFVRFQNSRLQEAATGQDLFVLVGATPAVRRILFLTRLEHWMADEL